MRALILVSALILAPGALVAEPISAPERLWQNRGAKALELLKKLDSGARCKKMLESSFALYGTLETARERELIKKIEMFNKPAVKVSWAILNEKRDSFGAQISFVYDPEGTTAAPIVVLHTLGKGWSVWSAKDKGIIQIVSDKCEFAIDQSDPLKTQVNDKTY